MTRIARLVAIATSLLLVQVIAQGQNRITGRVLSFNGRAVPQVFVELLNDVDRVIFRTRTDGSGSFFFVGMGTGRFIVRVLPYGTDFEEQTQEVQISNLSIRQGGGSSSEDITIHLLPRRNAEATRSATAVIFAQDVPDAARKAYEKAIRDLDGNLRDRGMDELKAALDVFPIYFLALERMAMELIKAGNFSEAKVYLERAVDINEKSSNCWYGLAYASYAIGQVPRSVEAAQKAAELAPNSSEIALMLGIALRKDKNFPDAEKALLNANKLAGGKSADVFWNLALLYAYNIQNYRLAADALEDYLKVNPNHPNADLLRKLIKQYREKASS